MTDTILTRLEAPLPGRMSYSSLSSYTECGERWRLERLYGIEDSTWFATVAGSTLHELTEKIDHNLFNETDYQMPTFKESFDHYLAEEYKAGLEVKPSGKVLKNVGPNGGPNKKDYDWWLEMGPKLLDSYRAWRAESDLVLATLPNGDPCIEVSITCDVGGETFRGYIDRVFRRPDGELVIVDLKFGKDSGILQLGTYRVGLLREYGMEANLGAFWSGAKGELGWHYDLTLMSESYIDAQFEMAWRGIRAGVFIASPGNFCNACDGKPFCRAGGGTQSGVIPIRTRMVPHNVTLTSSPEGV